MAVRRTLGDSENIGAKEPQGTTGSNHVSCDTAYKWDVVSRVDRALLGDDDDDAHKIDRSKWRMYTQKIYGLSPTWYGDSGASRHMQNTRDGKYEYKPCKAVHVCTSSKQKLPVFRNWQDPFGSEAGKPRWSVTR